MIANDDLVCLKISMSGDKTMFIGKAFQSSKNKGGGGWQFTYYVCNLADWTLKWWVQWLCIE